MGDVNFTAEEKILKAKIRLGDDPPSGRPFFSYLVSHLKFTEKKECKSISVDAYGNCYFNPKFIDSLSDDEIFGVLCHEVLHVVLEHITTANELKQEPELSNIAHDIIVNNILVRDNMKIPSCNGGSLIPKDNSIQLAGYKVVDINKKTSSEVYDELYNHLSKKSQQQMKSTIGESSKGRFDEHIQPKDGECQGKEGDKENSENEGNPFKNENELQNHWRKVLLDACSHARNRGSLPAGMDRIVETLMEPKVNWKTYLFKYMSSMIPCDFTWKFPSKKTISTGIYLPSTEKESIEVISAIDTSGSISNDELRVFLSELVSITRSFRNIDLTILDCDANIHGVHRFKNATVNDILKKVRLKGGGGTSHKPIFRWLKKERPRAKFIICFTDGYTDFPDKKDVKIDTLWVVAGENKLDKKEFPFGKVIVVK